MQNTQRKTLSLPPREKRAFKPKRWSHQDVLADQRGKQFRLKFVDGRAQTGELLEADQFTLLFRLVGNQSALIVFKSALASIEPIETVGKTER